MKKQDGFGAVAVIIVLLVIGITSVVAYRIVSRRSDDKTATNGAVNSPTAAVQNGTSATPPASTAQEPKAASSEHIDITEWGVRLSFDGAGDVTYVMETQDDGDRLALLTVKEGVTSVEACKSLYTQVNRSESSITGEESKIGSHYYWLTGNKDDCFGAVAEDNPAYSIHQRLADQIGYEKYSFTAL